MSQNDVKRIDFDEIYDDDDGKFENTNPIHKKTGNNIQQSLPMQGLIEIAVDILKQTIDNENQTMKNLVDVAVSILRTQLQPERGKWFDLFTGKIGFKGFKGFKMGFTMPNFEYTLPSMTVRLKRIVTEEIETDYYDVNGQYSKEGIKKKSKTTCESIDDSDTDVVNITAVVTPKYDTNDYITIIAYNINPCDKANGELGENDLTAKKLENFNIDAISSVNINLKKLNDETYVQQAKQDMLEKLEKNYEKDENMKNFLNKYFTAMHHFIENKNNESDGFSESYDDDNESESVIDLDAKKKSRKKTAAKKKNK